MSLVKIDDLGRGLGSTRKFSSGTKCGTLSLVVSQTAGLTYGVCKDVSRRVAFTRYLLWAAVGSGCCFKYERLRVSCTTVVMCW